MTFDLTTNSITLDNALFCATLCQGAYSAAPVTFIESMELTMVAQATANPYDCYWYIVTDGKAHYLVFRGTVDVTNWLKDGTFFQVVNPKGPGNIHKGFEETLANQYSIILGHLKEANAKTLIITGHSLGGALAAMIADWFDDDQNAITPLVCYTFGCPRIGDIPFSNDYAPKHFRFVNSGDIVPRLPPPAILQGLSIKMYHHCGESCYISSSGLVVGGGMPVQLLFLDEHFIENYIKSIQVLMIKGE